MACSKARCGRQKITFVFPENMHAVAIPPRCEGRTRGRHDTWSAGSGGRIGLQHELIMRTNNIGADVKSCGPGVPELTPSSQCFDEHAGDGGKTAGPRGDHV
jgi:hypothetical protein